MFLNQSFPENNKGILIFYNNLRLKVKASKKVFNKKGLVKF